MTTPGTDSGRKTLDAEGASLDPWYADGPGSANGSGSPNGGSPSADVTRPVDHPLLGDVPSTVAEFHQAYPQVTEPSHGPNRWLRVLTGVDERLLDRVWQERPRYTRLGAIILGTATMAMLSMMDALDQVFGPVWPVIIVVGLFWGAFVGGIDGWLIASTHGQRSARWRIFLPRLALALLFGIIIATPLMLTVFGSEVVSQAKNDQNNSVTAYDSRVATCNPLPGTPPASSKPAPDCAGYYVSVNDPVIGTNDTIAQEKMQRTQLITAISADNKTIANDNLVAREECNGNHGAGLSGIVGQGPNCDRDRREADAFASQSHVAQLETQLSVLNQQIASQTVTAGQQTQEYATALSSAIAARDKVKLDDEGSVGLLNRIDALGQLAARSAVIAMATVLLGLFIITIDCLPVLSKMMSGETSYDRLVDARLRMEAAMAMAGMEVSERRETGKAEVALHRLEHEVRAQLDRMQDASRVEKAHRDADLDRRIAELAAELRRQAAEEETNGESAG
jgi:hypothetical protein